MQEEREFQLWTEGECIWEGEDPMPYIREILEKVKQPVSLDVAVYEHREDGDHEIVSVLVDEDEPYRVIRTCPNYSLTPGFSVYSFQTCEQA